MSPHTQASEQIDGIARRLEQAYEVFAPIAPVRDALEGGGIEAAYAVQRSSVDRWVAHGRRLVGRKIGLTSSAVQRQLGVDQPDFGALFADMLVDDGGSIPSTSVLQPRVEAEVALILGADLDGEELSLSDLAAAVESVAPALEIVGSRIANWDISILDTVADNASSGLFVLGPAVSPAGLDLAAVTMEMRFDAEVVSSGTGADCLGHPYNAGLWLAQTMAALGSPLRAGDVVLSGALGPMVDLPAQVKVVAEISGVGSVSVSTGGRGDG